MPIPSCRTSPRSISWSSAFLSSWTSSPWCNSKIQPSMRNWTPRKQCQLSLVACGPYQGLVATFGRPLAFVMCRASETLQGLLAIISLMSGRVLRSCKQNMAEKPNPQGVGQLTPCPRASWELTTRMITLPLISHSLFVSLLWVSLFGHQVLALNSCLRRITSCSHDVKHRDGVIQQANCGFTLRSCSILQS